MNSIASAVDKTGFCLLTSCVVFAPIPFGSNAAHHAGFIGLLLAVCLLGTLLVPLPNRPSRRLANTALLVCAIIVLWSLAQVIPWGTALPGNPIWHRTGDLLGNPEGTISVSRHQALHSLGYVILPLVGFISSLVYVRGDARYLRFLHVALGTGVIVTILCIGQYVVSPRMLLWSEKKYYLESFTGTFVNPNTAATYFGLMLLLSLSICLSQFKQISMIGPLAARNMRVLDHRIMERFLAYSACTLIFAVALLLTRSRAGIISSVLGVCGLAVGFVFLSLRRRTSALVVFTLTSLCLAGMALLFYAYGGLLFRRLQIEGVVDEARLCTYKSVWRAIRDNFGKGAGLGTFQDIFPGYRLPECGVYGYWDTAHNVYLEGWLGSGCVFLVCLLIVYYRLIETFVRGVRDRRRLQFVPLSCIGVLAIVTLHSLFDFSLQIPAVALLVSATLGSGAGVSLARAT